MNNMIEKYLFGALSSLLGLFTPIVPLCLCAAAFTAIDFVTGVLADRQRTLRNNLTWIFQSRKAWKTIKKLCFIMAGIWLAWLIDDHIITFRTLHLANIFTAFVCGVEFWSYLENASVISNTPIFEMFRNFYFRYLSCRGKE